MGLQINIPFILESLIKIVLSIFCGFVLGLERKRHNQIVGMRTLILISSSSTLLGILSYYMACPDLSGISVGGDVTRISAGVISGVGFLGAGAILKQGLNIKGLTSAAIIWTTASLGLALGGGLYVQSLFLLVIILVFLVSLEKLEGKLFPAGSIKTLHLCFETDNLDMIKLKMIIEKHNFIVIDLNMSRVISSKQIIIRYSVKAPHENDFSALIEELKIIGNLTEFSITD